MSATPRDHDPIRPEPPATYYEGTVQIPGFGDSPDRCRPLSPVGFCHDGHVVLGRSSCATRECPEHWRDWIEEATISVTARIAAYREAVDGAEKRTSHVVASPPQDRRYTAERMYATRSEAYDALEAAGVAGGAVVTHPYRTSDRGNALYATARDLGELEEDTGRWAFLRDVAEDWDDMRRYIEPSPHYHALAPGRDIRGEEAPAGWVVERIRTVDPFHRWDTDAYRDMAASVYYILTHGAVGSYPGETGPVDANTLTYFGAVHPACFNPEEELTAAVWDRIQREAERAVTERPPEGPGAESEPGRTCPVDECEAVVHELMYLRDYLDDSDWVAAVRSHRDGRNRWLQLRGMLHWWDNMVDRPPPSTRISEERMREWLEARGAATTPQPDQRALDGLVSI